MELPDTEWDTVGGLVFNLLGHVPEEGETVRFQDLELRTERVQGRRIGRCCITPSAAEHETSTSAGRRAAGRGRVVTVTFRSGFVTLVGRPNVGKSTLVNRMVGAKVAIVSDRPQTTRTQIRGVRTTPDRQIVLLDTPGIHKPRTLLGERTNERARATLAEVDVVCMLVEASAPIGRGDRFVAELVQQVDTPKILVVNKIDLATQRRGRRAPRGRRGRARRVRRLRAAVGAHRRRRRRAGRRARGAAARGPALLPGRRRHRPARDVPRRRAAPRAAAARRARRAAALDHRRRRGDRARATRPTTILRVSTVRGSSSERESQKGIVIGKGGAVLKEAGTRAREELEALLGTPRVPRDPGQGRTRLAAPRPCARPPGVLSGVLRAARRAREHDAMHALLFGVAPRKRDHREVDTDNPLLAALERTPMDFLELPDPGFLLPDWVVTRPLPHRHLRVGREAGVHGLGRGWRRQPDARLLVDAAGARPRGGGRGRGAGPRGRGGRRRATGSVLNPWLSCVPRGVSPICPACAAGDLSLCWNFQTPPIAPGIHIGTSKDASGGWATLMPAHPSMLFPVPDDVPDEVAVFADPFAVSLHAITRHPPTPGGKVLVYGAGALGTCAVAILRALYPDVEVGVVARFGAQAELARQARRAPGVRARAGGSRDRGRRRVVGWRALVAHTGCRWRSPAASTSCTTPSPSARRSRCRSALLKAHGTLVKAGVHGTDQLGVDAALLQGDQLGRLERVRRRGGRRRARARHRALPRARRARVGSTSTAC